MAEETQPILVLCDSLSYYGPAGGLPSDDPRIWPNIVAKRFHTHAIIAGRIGWTTRDVYWALIQDPNIWSAIPHISAVIIAVGGMDTLPSPIPTALRESMRYIRPHWLRKSVRAIYNRLQAPLSLLGWPQALPVHIQIEYLEKIVQAISTVRPNLPIFLAGPGYHSAKTYHKVHNGYYKALTPLLDWADEHKIPYINVRPIVQRYFLQAEQIGIPEPTVLLANPELRDKLMVNPDGIHWGFDLHADVAAETYRILAQTLE